MIYMDNAATVPVDPDVFRAMQPYYMEQFGNPSSPHSMGRKAREAIDKARKQCANALSCEPEQIFFTSGATEADNWAMRMHAAYIRQSEFKNGAILYSAIEHKAVINSIRKELGCPLQVNEDGFINLNDVCEILKSVQEEAITFAVMSVCNETGTEQPVHRLSDLCYQYKVPLHVDATQEAGKRMIALDHCPGITSLAISGHKIGAGKGIGLLYVRDPDAKYIKPFINGGGQERKLRAGTENVPGIVGLGVAMEKIANSEFDHSYIKEMHDFLKVELDKIPQTRFNCRNQLPHYLSVSFRGILGEALVLSLDRRGICVSSGSACNTGSLEPSHVLKAIGVPDDYINGTIRISLSEQNTLEECKTVAETIKEEVAKLRSVSPTWKGE